MGNNKEIKRILELDSKRTQGEWKSVVEKHLHIDDIFEIQYGNSGECISEITHGKDTAEFIASAPRMAQIIREQQELLKECEHALVLSTLMVSRKTDIKRLTSFAKKVEERNVPILKKLQSTGNN